MPAQRTGFDAVRARLPRRAAWLGVLALAAPAGCDDFKDSITPEPPRAAAIEPLSGTGQRAIPGHPLPAPVTVRVLDAGGQPLPGVRVEFRPGAGHGTADPASATSGGGGEAETSWTLGPGPGLQKLSVSADEITTEIGAEAIDLEAELDALFAPPPRS